MQIDQDVAQFVSDYMQIPGDGKVTSKGIAEALLEQEPAAAQLSDDEFDAEVKKLIPDIDYYRA